MKSLALQSVKFSRLKRRLKLPQWQVVGLLESLWLFTQTNAIRGDIGRFSNEDIAAAMEWDGDHDQLIHNLVESGWLDHHPEHRLVVHDWADHCPTFIRGTLAASGQSFAENGQLPRESPKDAPKELPRETPKDTPKDAPCGVPTKPSQAKPSQEEEKHPSDVFPETPKPASPGTTQPPPKPVLEFPADGGIKTWVLTEAKLSQYREAFPSLDVLAEFRAARQWLIDNAHRRRTATGMPRFLTNWLSRAQNQRAASPPRNNGPPSKPSARESPEEMAARITREAREKGAIP